MLCCNVRLLLGASYVTTAIPNACSPDSIIMFVSRSPTTAARCTPLSATVATSRACTRRSLTSSPRMPVSGKCHARLTRLLDLPACLPAPLLPCLFVAIADPSSCPRLQTATTTACTQSQDISTRTTARCALVSIACPGPCAPSAASLLHHALPQALLWKRRHSAASRHHHV